MRKLTKFEKMVVLDIVSIFVEDLAIVVATLPLNDNVLKGGDELADSLREFVELVIENAESE